MAGTLLSLLPGILGLAAAGAIILTVTHYVRKGKRTMKKLFGTDDLGELINLREQEEANTPKSVSGLTNIYSPMIQRDFPELNINELRTTAEGHLMDFLLNKGFTNIHFHQTEIREYVHKSGTCSVVFQTAVELFANGKKKQTRYNTHMIYVQDADLYAEVTGVGLTCPNCGGSISVLGAKHCIYCGCAVIPINMNVWELDKIVEV